MTKRELDSLTVVKDPKYPDHVLLVNSSGPVQRFRSRDTAYARIRQLRAGAKQTRREALRAKRSS